MKGLTNKRNEPGILVHFFVKGSSSNQCEFERIQDNGYCKALHEATQSFASANAILLREKQHIFLDSTFGRGKLKKLSTSETIIIDI